MKKETKKCTGCGRELPLSEFRRQKGTEDGLNPRCKECCDKSIGRVGFNRMLKGATVVKEEDLLTLAKVVIAELRNRGFNVNIKITRTQEIEL